MYNWLFSKGIGWTMLIFLVYKLPFPHVNPIVLTNCMSISYHVVHILYVVCSFSRWVRSDRNYMWGWHLAYCDNPIFCKLQKKYKCQVCIKDQYTKNDKWDSSWTCYSNFQVQFWSEAWEHHKHWFYHDNLSHCVGGLHENLLLFNRKFQLHD